MSCATAWTRFVHSLFGTLGDIQAVATLFDAMPIAADMDPEACYVGMEIDFRGSVDKTTLENVFGLTLPEARGIWPKIEERHRQLFAAT